MGRWSRSEGGRLIKTLTVVLIALLLVSLPVSQAWAQWRGGHGGHGHFHGRVFIGTSFWWPPYPYYYPYYYPYPYAAYPPAPVIVDQPVVYTQQQPAPESYWYFCDSAKAYYPTAPTCPEAWIKVAPRSE